MEDKKTLEDKLQEVYDLREDEHTMVINYLQTKAKDILYSIDPLFEAYRVEVGDEKIHITSKEGRCKYFEVRRVRIWGLDVKFDEPKINSGYSNQDDPQFLILLGKVAYCQLYDITKWNELCSLMDECFDMSRSEKIKKYNETIHTLNKHIEDIKTQKFENKLKRVMEVGEFKLNKRIKYRYGNGRWDFVNSDWFKWDLTSGKKTYVVTYKVDGDFFRIHKRIKVKDLETFVRQNFVISED